MTSLIFYLTFKVIKILYLSNLRIGNTKTFFFFFFKILSNSGVSSFEFFKYLEIEELNT